jgi:hypothetical protein
MDFYLDEKVHHEKNMSGVEILHTCLNQWTLKDKHVNDGKMLLWFVMNMYLFSIRWSHIKLLKTQVWHSWENMKTWHTLD